MRPRALASSPHQPQAPGRPERKRPPRWVDSRHDRISAAMPTHRSSHPRCRIEAEGALVRPITAAPPSSVSAVKAARKVTPGEGSVSGGADTQPRIATQRPSHGRGRPRPNPWGGAARARLSCAFASMRQRGYGACRLSGRCRSSSRAEVRPGGYVSPRALTGWGERRPDEWMV